MRYALSLLISMLATTVVAADFAIGELTVSHPKIRETAKSAMAGAGYLAITNNGPTADVLLAVEADFPRVMLHDTVMEGDVAKMEHLMSVGIAPGETITFEPGGRHIMFMGLNGDPLEAGETVPAVLIFETAGRLDVVFDVVSTEDLDAGHGGH